MSPIISGGGGGGGSQPPTATATVTTDPNTFAVTHDFDFGGPAQGLLAATVTAIAADGQAFGDFNSGNPGFILEGTDGFGPGWSSDAITFHMGSGTSLITGRLADGQVPGFAVGHVFTGAFATPRVLRVPLTIFDDGGNVVYTGIHHPTVTARIDIVHLAVT